MQVNSVDRQDLTFVEKVRALWYKIFPKHNRIQRFALNGCLILGIIIVCIGLSVKKYHEENTVRMTNQAVYTTDFTTSKSFTKGRVLGVLTNKLGNTAFVFFKFDDTNSIPLDAKQYHFFLAATNPKQQYQEISSQPNLKFYLFGSTGYAGVYLHNGDNARFPSQILNLTVRAKTQIGQANDDSDDFDYHGLEKSFKYFDQFRIYFNPGASKATYLDLLDDPDMPSTQILFKRFIIDNKEKKLKKQLDEQLQTMQIDLNNIKDRGARLRDYDRIIVPAAPKYIRNDKIILNNKNKLELKTTQVAPGGFDFAWRDLEVGHGLLQQQMRHYDLNPKKTDPDDFIDRVKHLSSMIDTSDTSLGMSTDYPGDRWKFKTGKKVDLNNTDGNSDSDDSDDDSNGSYISKQMHANNDIAALTKAWDTYINDKKKYQTELLEKWLELEAMNDNISRFSTINDVGRKSLTIY